MLLAEAGGYMLGIVCGLGVGTLGTLGTLEVIDESLEDDPTNVLLPLDDGGGGASWLGLV